MLIIAKPAASAQAASGSSGITVQSGGISLPGSFTTLNLSGSLVATGSSPTAVLRLSGSAVGTVMYSMGGAPTMQLPLTSDQGWLVSDDGYMLVVG